MQRRSTFVYLSRTDVEKVGLAMTEVINAVEAAFIEKGNGRTTTFVK